MNLQLNKIIPIPLKDKFLQRSSDVWNMQLQYAKGEWIKIKAPSGTGKTTLMHILYKLRSDYDGSVVWDGNEIRNTNADALSQLRQQKLSIIFQDLRLFPQLSARENIELKRVMQQPFYESSMIDAMAERLGVSHIINQRAGLCSYGEQQRVAIIRSLMQPFHWLLMDEPFSHLDKDNINKAAALIAEECTKRNAGFILTDLDSDEHFKYTKVMSL